MHRNGSEEQEAADYYNCRNKDRVQGSSGFIFLRQEKDIRKNQCFHLSVKQKVKFGAYRKVLALCISKVVWGIKDV